MPTKITKTKTNRIPLYLQISEIFRQNIEEGIWEKEKIIPSIDSLTQEYSVARVTIRQAIKILVEEGLLITRRGYGTVVTKKNSNRQWCNVESTFEKLMEIYNTKKPTTKNLKTKLQYLPYTLDGAETHYKYQYFKRVHSLNNKIYCWLDLYLCHQIYETNPSAYDNGFTVPIIATDPNIKISNAKQVLKVLKCDLETAEILEINVGDPVVEMHRTIYNDKNKIIYLSIIKYRGQDITLDMDFNV